MVSLAPTGRFAIVKTKSAPSLTLLLPAASLDMYSKPALGASVTSTFAASKLPSLVTTTA